MYKNLIYGILLVFLMYVCNIAAAQETVNLYSAVSEITGNLLTVENSVENPIFKANDTVLLIQMTGAEQKINEYNNAGKYQFHIVRSVNGNKVTLISDPNSQSLNFNPDKELVQLIKVPSYKNHQINNPLSCYPWDGKIGGVVALMVEETLTLNAVIDVSSFGFRGGGLSGNYAGDCSDNAGYSKKNYTNKLAAKDSAGYKGEGILSYQTYTRTPRGYGNAYNGGGGGNGKYAGGGGGGNGGNGGRGDIQVCGVPSKPLDNYGDALSYNENWEWQKRAIMGGGGGSGTGDNTPGGNGGGIVIIAAGKIKFGQGGAIKSNGSSVVGSVTKGGAGGGGAGGSILLSVGRFDGFYAEVKGGDGGDALKSNCTDQGDSRGSGGGGGSGLVYVSMDENQFKSLYSSGVINTVGKNGDVRTSAGSCQMSQAQSGSAGHFIMGGLQLELRGFAYNFITTPDTSVCYGSSKTIRASVPQGGVGGYTYEWQSSVDGESWSSINNSNVQNYTISFNTTTLSYRRIVTTVQDRVTISDTSLPVKITVVPQIENTLVLANDTTVCDNATVKIDGPVSGGYGVGSYTYQWLRDGVIVPGDGKALTVSWESESKSRDILYTRLVTSTETIVCKSSSEPSMIHVLPVMVANAGVDQILNFKYETNMAATLPEGATEKKWEKISGEMRFADDQNPNTRVTGLQIGTNIAQWTVSNSACSASDQVVIEVTGIPSAFSPNGDGINDCFQVGIARDSENSELIVFNRDHNVVYKAKPYKGSGTVGDCTGWWDGHDTSGKELPSGTYFYQLTVDETVYKGYVVLKR